MTTENISFQTRRASQDNMLEMALGQHSKPFERTSQIALLKLQKANKTSLQAKTSTGPFFHKPNLSQEQVPKIWTKVFAVLRNDSSNIKAIESLPYINKGVTVVQMRSMLEQAAILPEGCINLVLDHISDNLFFQTLGDEWKKNPLKMIEYFSQSSQSLAKLLDPKELAVTQSKIIATSGSFDTLLQAYDHFTFEPASTFEAMQNLELHASMLIAPFIFSNILNDMAEESLPLKRIHWFYFSLISMISFTICVNLYKRFRPIPNLVNPFINYSLEAEKKRFDPLIGREEILQKIFACWESSNKGIRQHPLLVGPAGVGKTSLITEIARQIATDELPENVKMFFNVKKVFGCSGSSLLPRPSQEFQSEDKMERALKRLNPHKFEVLLAIDEVHTLMADAFASTCGERLKAVLDFGSRGFPFFIAATTDEEYRKFIASNINYSRRFRAIYVEQTNRAQTQAILRDMILRINPEESASISDELLGKVYDLTTERLSKYHQPDISKRILMRAISSLRLSVQTPPSYDKAQAKSIEYENLLSQYIDIIDDASQEHQFRLKLKRLEDEKMALEKSCSQEADQRANFQSLVREQNASKMSMVRLAKQITEKKNIESTKKLEKLFTFYAEYKFPLLSQEIERLKNTASIPCLDIEYIANLIDQFKIEEESEMVHSCDSVEGFLQKA